MFGQRVLLLMFTMCLAGSSALNSQRYQRDHATGGSYLANVRTASSTKVKSSQVSTKKKTESPQVLPKSACVTTTLPKQPAQAIVTSTGLPIVDIFFILPDMTKAAFARMQHYWVLPTVAAMLAKTTNTTDSEVRIHVLSDSIKILDKASSLGFYSYDLVPYIKKHNRFLNRVARTVDSTSSELKFFRWKVLNQIVRDWNSHGAASLIRRVMVLDGEVLLTVNAAALFDKAVALAMNDVGTSAQKNPVAPEAIYITDSVMLYSPQGLNAFDSYADEWFNDCTCDELHQKSVGTHDRPWSDVILFEHFANTSTPATLRVKWFDTVAPNAKLEQKQIQFLGCEPLDYYDNPNGVHVRVNGLPYQLRGMPPHQVFQDPRVHDIHIVGPNTEYPYCFMGFVHKHVKGLMYAYGRALEILRGGEEAHNPSALDPLAGDLLLAPDKSREVYYIHSHSTRAFIANKEEFKNLFLARGQVIGRVPIGIIEAFRPLPLRYPWKEGEIISFGVDRTLYYVDKDNVLRPLASLQVFKQLKQTMDDVKTYKDYSGPILRSISMGPTIKVDN